MAPEALLMKSILLLTANGPLLILTSHESLDDPKLLQELKLKGLRLRDRSDDCVLSKLHLERRFKHPLKRGKPDNASECLQ